MRFMRFIKTLMAMIKIGTNNPFGIPLPPDNYSRINSRLSVGPKIEIQIFPFSVQINLINFHKPS